MMAVRAVLIVVHDGDLATLLQFLLDVKHSGDLMFEVDAAERGFQRLYDLYRISRDRVH